MSGILVLIRHVTPLVPHGLCNAKQAQERAKQYDGTQNLALAEADAFQSQAEYGRINRIARIYSSPLPRAKCTAEKLFSNRRIEYLDGLREFNLKIFSIPLIKMPFGLWLALSRLLWFFGMNPAGASAAQEQRRVLDLIPVLLEQDTAVVAHGFVLRTIRKRIRRYGFRKTFRYRQGCFCVEIWQSCAK